MIATKEKGKSMSLEDAKELANEIERVEAALKQMKDQLKSFVKVHGQVDTDEKVWTEVPSESWKFEPVKLKDMATDMAIEGHNPWEIFNISSTNLKKLGWDDDVLRNYGEKTVRTTFRAIRKS